VNWALSFRVQPDRDMRVTQGMIGWLDPSTTPDEETVEYPIPSGSSAVLIDATTKWDYPPVSLPRKEFMEKAMKIWEEEGLPALTMKEPWHGYTLGRWTEENEEEAQLAVKGEHYRTGEKLAKQRTKL
jgi:4-hydroxy-3-polyprenylbenzoate decarboxylase